MKITPPMDTRVPRAPDSWSVYSVSFSRDGATLANVTGPLSAAFPCGEDSGFVGTW